MKKKGRKAGQTSSSSLFTWSSASLLLALAVYCAFHKFSFSENQIKQEIIRLDASTAGFSYKKLAEMRKPALLRSTIANSWKAASWTAEMLNEKLGNVSAYKQIENPVFITFHDNKPLEPFVKSKWSDFNRKINTSVLDVFNGNPKESEETAYLYFSQDIGQLRTKFSDILSHVQPIRDLVLSEHGVQINLWIGREGITTYTHYDATYNFFVQIQGKKQFTLFPPSVEMYLYPCLHPHYGHSQTLNHKPVDKAKFPQYNGESQRIDVVLKPGDMLVLPPFWYHQVTTMKSSVSVNVWNDAPEYLLMEEIYKKPVPLELHWEISKRVIRNRIYIHMLVQRLEQNSDDFLHDLFYKRYYPLHGFNPKEVDLVVSDSTRKEMKDLCSATRWRDHVGPFVHDANRGLAEIIPLFKQLTIKSIQTVLLGNYIEHLINTCVGTERVYSFLLFCQQTGLS